MPEKPASVKANSQPGTFTPEKKRKFLDLYATGGSVVACAQAIGISHVTIFKHKKKDADFAKEFDLAMETNTDQLEDHLHRMAVEKGVPGNVAALFGTLKARRPGKWRDSYKVEHEGKIEITTAQDLEAARSRAKNRGVEALN